MRPISFRDVDITGGFWKQRQDVNSNSTIYAVRDRFIETGRFDAFRFEWKEGMPNRPHFFWDSDVAKWLESVAFILEKQSAPELEALADETIDLIEKNQEENGYFNIYFTVVEPDKRFSNRDWHELYCAGHLTEAAIAYYNATGKDKFLKCMCRYLELIDRVFRVEDSAAFHTPGHEEIELALVKLYKCTGEKKWLELSKHFIDRRGVVNETPEDFWCNSRNFQSHVPCREMRTAEGHSVRAGYLYSGMADIAREYSDKELEEACLALFDDIYYKKLYITGGIGQSSSGEAFTVPYDLPNTRAYTETCASIALVYFASRMEQLKLDSRFADVVETAIFNGMLSGVSLDGKSFFYQNPLEIIHAIRARNVSVPRDNEFFPEATRQAYFNCSCCPPNVTRFVASIGDYIYGSDDSTLFIRQYIASRAKVDGTDVEMSTLYPYDGKVVIKIEGTDKKMAAMRIPAFSADNFSIIVNGTPVQARIDSGYAFVEISGNAVIELNLDVSAKIVYANPLVNEDAGKAAVKAGPVVYCAESVDNGENLRAITLSPDAVFTKVENNALGTVDLEAEALRLKSFNGLYTSTREYEKIKLHLIPFFAFANRDECDMTVWLTSK